MKKIFPYLTYAGAIPFILCAACLYVNIQNIPILGSAKKILSIYGLVILSFLSGSHWGQHLSINKGLWAIPIFSNIIVIILCLGFLVLSFKMKMALFITAFVTLLIIDHQLFHINVITYHYFQTRCLISAIVIISLIISAVVS